MSQLSSSPKAALAASDAAPSFFSTWVDKRLVQVAGVYLASAWTFFQFVQWCVNRYVLSPHLVDLCLLLILLLLPTVLLVAHAGKRHGGWTRLQKVGIPCNVLGAAALLFVFFGGKDLGSAQTTVTLMDAAGNAVERVVPKSEFRKHVAVFFFDNETGDADLDWLRYAVPEALFVDQMQDLFMALRTQGSFSERIRQAGFPRGFGLPLALQRQIAKERQADYVLHGAILPAAEGYRIETTLTRAANGKPVETRTFEGSDVLALVDELGVQLKRDLEIPNGHLEETVDLPVAELLTSDFAAFRAYAGGNYARTFGQNPAEAERLFDEATERDPTFAYAHLQRGELLLDQQRMAEGKAAFEQVQRYDYRVPERLRYAINGAVFFFDRQPEEALQSAEQWTTLFPYDTEGFSFLAQIYRMQGETDAAVAALRTIIELDPNRTGRYLQIGDLLRDDGRLDEAEAAYRAYIDAAPDDPDGFRRLGNLQGRQGDFDGKLEAYRQALVLEPDDPDAMTALAAAHLQRGSFDDAEALYERALKSARTPRERYGAQNALAWYYNLRGQGQRCLDSLRASWATLATYSSATDLLRERAMRATTFAANGDPDAARRFIAEVRAHPAAQDGFLALNADIWEAFVLAELGAPEQAEPLIERARTNIDTYGIDAGSWLEQAHGRVYEAQERWADAEKAFEAYVAEEPASAYGWTQLGEARLAQDDVRGAAEAFTAALRVYPSYPEAHLGLAHVAHRRGEASTAHTHLDRALAAWGDADPTFEPAAEARVLATKLSGV